MILQEKKLFDVCGGCRWRYKLLDIGQYVFEITPVNPECGSTLDEWKEFLPWHEVDFLGAVKKVVIARGVAVIDMRGMFQDCYALTSLDVSGWNVSNVIDVGYVFFGCESLISLDASGWDMSSTLDMTSMFLDCKSLTSLDIDMKNIPDETDTAYMFQSCDLLKHQLQEAKDNFQHHRSAACRLAPRRGAPRQTPPSALFAQIFCDGRHSQCIKKLTLHVKYYCSWVCREWPKIIYWKKKEEKR